MGTWDRYTLSEEVGIEISQKTNVFIENGRNISRVQILSYGDSSRMHEIIGRDR